MYPIGWLEGLYWLITVRILEQCLTCVKHYIFINKYIIRYLKVCILLFTSPIIITVISAETTRDPESVHQQERRELNQKSLPK